MLLDAHELANRSDAIDAALVPRATTVARAFPVEREV